MDEDSVIGYLDIDGLEAFGQLSARWQGDALQHLSYCFLSHCIVVFDYSMNL